jgi:hypothetical protein
MPLKWWQTLSDNFYSLLPVEVNAESKRQKHERRVSRIKNTKWIVGNDFLVYKRRNKLIRGYVGSQP